MSNALNELLKQPGIWRARARETGLECVASGFPALDEALPGGWPLGALTEILNDHTGIGELRLFMPALVRLSRQGRWIALVAPPHIPYAPALAQHGLDLSRLLLIHPRDGTDALWAVEQALHSGACGAVLAWPRRVDGNGLRRLQLAAEAGHSLGLMFRSRASAATPSPAVLRLQLDAGEDGTRIRLLKCRGGGFGRELAVRFAEAVTGLRGARGEPSCAASANAPPRSRPGARTPGTRSGRRRAAQMDLPLVPARFR